MINESRPMNYYEELGVSPKAAEGEIRKAHRRLTKLYHPDQHIDEDLKQTAEEQMRQVNIMVHTLLDPDLRREYDESLEDELPGMSAARLKRHAIRSLPWWLASTAGAILLTVIAVWFFADKWGSSFGNRTPTYIPSEATVDEPSRPAAAPRPAIQSPAPPIVAAANKLPVPVQSANVEAGHEATVSRNEQAPVLTPAVAIPRQANAPAVRASPPVQLAARRRTLRLPRTNVQLKARVTQIIPPPPPNVAATPVLTGVGLPVSALPAPVPLRAASGLTTGSGRVAYTSRATPSNERDPLEGEWVYAPKEPEKRKPGYYPPEFIDLQLTSGSGGLRGQYHARYVVSDSKPVSPEISFILVPDGPRKWQWEASNGSRGTMKVNATDGESIRIEWHTTKYVKAPTLTSGFATLVRKSGS